MKQFVEKENKKWFCLLVIIMVLQFFAASYFCIQKQGFHYDEYYSYYSSNVTYGLVPTDREWKNVAEIRSEFQVMEGEGFRYGLVKTMQGFDVHPPLYYMILHTVCSLFPGIFSKWFGLGLNLFFFLICFWQMAYLANAVFKGNKSMVVLTCLLFGFQTGVLSGITFIRMYMLLTVWCLAVTIWHIQVWKKGLHMSFGNGVILGILVMLGFLTHYYFAVFLFFTAAYTCLYHWLVKKNLKSSICYGIVVCMGMAAAVLLYPASLSHIFRGYRGTEATDAFFDIGNTGLRLEFFTDLMNQSVFGGSLWILLLLFFLLVVGIGFRIKGKEKIIKFIQENQGIVHIAFVTGGYFLVVAKTALLNAEEANRYELPVYGFCMLLMIAAFYYLLQGIWKRDSESQMLEKHSGEVAVRPFLRTKKVFGIFGVILVILVLGSQFLSLTQGKVQFLYREDRANVEWAKEHKDRSILYLYNPNNVWMIWDESEELMQYDKIYFVSLADTAAITDKILLSEEEIYVYTSRMEEADTVIEELMKDNVNLKQKDKIRELLYCDLYYLH